MIHCCVQTGVIEAVTSEFAAFLAISKTHPNQSDQHTVLQECTMSSNKSNNICKALWSES